MDLSVVLFMSSGSEGRYLGVSHCVPDFCDRASAGPDLWYCHSDCHESRSVFRSSSGVLKVQAHTLARPAQLRHDWDCFLTVGLLLLHMHEHGGMEVWAECVAR